MATSILGYVSSRALLLAPCLLLQGAPAQAASPFDGTYAGPQVETKNNNSGHCLHINRDRVTLVVKDGVAKYKWGVPLEAPVAADGSFFDQEKGLAIAGASPSIIIKGRITGPKLEADVGTPACAAHLSLTRL